MKTPELYGIIFYLFQLLLIYSKMIGWLIQPWWVIMSPLLVLLAFALFSKLVS